MIRNIQINDFNKNYLNLLNQLSKTKFNFDEFEKYVNNLNDNHHIRVIEINNRIIATGTLFIESKLIHNINKVGHIEDIIIDKNHRGKGYGMLIINNLIDIAKKNNCYKVILNCNNNLRKFYEKCGLEYKGCQMAKYFSITN